MKQSYLTALCATIKEFKTRKFKETHSADCRKRAEDLFDKDKCFERYVELYESLAVKECHLKYNAKYKAYWSNVNG